jgi:hypothetical protein
MSWNRAQFALLLLGLCLLRQVSPPGGVGRVVFVALLALPCAAVAASYWRQRLLESVGAIVSGGALCVLALQRPELWLQTSLAAALVLGGGAAQRWLGPRAVALALGLGVGAPLALGLVLAALSPSGKHILSGELGDWGIDFSSIGRFARWLALSLAFLRGSVPLDSSRQTRWLSALPWVTLAMVLGPRLAWLVSTLTLRTDLLIWSEPPLLLNLWKLREGEPFYGPFSRFNSYSYSPALEHLQYGLLRPSGLELSLRAHRVLGVCWQLLAALCLTAVVSRFVGKGIRTRLGLAATCTGLLLTSLLAPHLHPDHLLMLGLCAAFWLVSSTEPPRGARLLLLLSLPALVTMVKLTGAGIGLGLGLIYLSERDWPRVAVVAAAGALALLTVPLFDSLLGNFSAYAIRLQASHPFDIERTKAVWQTPPLLCFLVALVLLAWRWRAARRAPAAHAARRVVLLTMGTGLTSLLAYAKHGGRDNSLLPFALGGALALLLVVADGPEVAAATNGSSEPTFFPLLGALLALLTPLTPPVLGATRTELTRMHSTAVAWVADSARRRQNILSASTAAYLDAGWPRVPDASPSTISELALAGRPEVSAFEARVRSGYYDALLLPASSLVVNPTFARLRPSLLESYVVVNPPELAGVWPTGLSGYVIAKRRAQPTGAHVIP